MRIEEIDRNFELAKLGETEYQFLDPSTPPLMLSGLPWFAKEREYCRLPLDTLEKQSDGVRTLAWNTAGVQVRFRSNSNKISLQVKLHSANLMSHMPATGQSGFDLYVGTGNKKTYLKTAIPPSNVDQYEAVIFDGQEQMEREFTINFPLYNGVEKLRIGLLPGTELSAPTAFTIPSPVLFYGSSITQGGCASRPGNCYCQILSRHLDFECLNFGFSGNARGELIMAEIIASLKLSAFVMDYDHNAPTAEYLQETHAPFYRLIRKQQPDLPIVMVSMPDVDLRREAADLRRKIIRKTYRQGLSEGDRNLYFVDGRKLFGNKDRDACTVDGCHPNDLGFFRMAEHIEPTLRKALKIQ
jgi:lysophospholipase L1-like esterase